MRWGLALVVLLAGCDAVLRLQTVAGPSGDGGTGDSGPCTPGLDDTMDEDCDGFPDATDLCPAEADTDPPANSDSDGAGDQCDPDNGIAADSIRLFDGFAQLGNGWVATGQWIFHDGKLFNVDKDAMLTQQVSVQRLLAETYVNFIDRDPSGEFVRLQIGDTGGTQYICELDPITGGVLVAAEAGGTTSSSMTVMGLGAIRLQMIEDDVMGRLRCIVSFGRGLRAEVDANGLAPGTPILGAQVMLRTSALHASFDSVTVVGVP